MRTHQGGCFRSDVPEAYRTSRAGNVDTVGLPLKAFVIGAGLILLVGTIVLAILVVLGVGGERQASLEDQPVAVPAPVARDAPLPLPAGATIEQVVPDPAGGPLILLGIDRDEAPFLAVVDLERGTLVRLIRFKREAAP
jgi:hypothetical protein